MTPGSGSSEVALVSAVLQAHACVCPPTPQRLPFAVQLLSQNSHSCVSHSKQKRNLCALCMYFRGVYVCFSLDTFVAYSWAATTGFEIWKICFVLFQVTGRVRLEVGLDGVMWLDCSHTQNTDPDFFFFSFKKGFNQNITQVN